MAVVNKFRGMAKAADAQYLVFVEPKALRTKKCSKSVHVHLNMSKIDRASMATCALITMGQKITKN